jgi:hypothetical protein
MLISTAEVASKERLEYQVILDEAHPYHPVQAEPAIRFSLEQLLKRTGPLPPYTALLGICTDGRPYLFDLTNPTSGSILINGGSQCGKTNLMRAALASIGRLNPAVNVRFGVLSAEPVEWADFLNDPHCLGVLDGGEEASASLIEDLAAIVMKRQNAGMGMGGVSRLQKTQDGPALLLVVDDLAYLKHNQPGQRFDLLCWLAQAGPQYGVRVLATMRTSLLQSEQAEIRSHFRTLMYGQAEWGENPIHTAALTLEPGQFAHQTGNRWVQFCSPAMQAC